VGNSDKKKNCVKLGHRAWTERNSQALGWKNADQHGKTNLAWKSVKCTPVRKEKKKNTWVATGPGGRQNQIGAVQVAHLMEKKNQCQEKDGEAWLIGGRTNLTENKEKFMGSAGRTWPWTYCSTKTTSSKSRIHTASWDLRAPVDSWNELKKNRSCLQGGAQIRVAAWAVGTRHEAKAKTRSSSPTDQKRNKKSFRSSE
jgi:hypothetical protein